MRESRNPFRLRSSESIDTDTTFLSLFEPGVLDVLEDRGLPTNVQLIRSAAGGGKTSLLRLFTPSVLRRLHVRRSEENELVSKLQALGAIDETGPTVLGVMLLCGRNYTGLDDLKAESVLKERLFIGLLNARILLAVLRSALAFRELRYPQDLRRLEIAAGRPGDALPNDLGLPCRGDVLHHWAKGLEERICGELDSFGPSKTTSLPGYEGLFSLALVRPNAIRVDGKQVARNVILMMDDTHMLTPHQRDLLVERVIEARSSVGIWIAERFEALSTHELLASGSHVGRDHDEPIEVEWYWRKRHQRFEKYVMRIADRRAKNALDTEVDHFKISLEANLGEPRYEEVFERAAQEVEERVRRRAKGWPQFAEWIESRSQSKEQAQVRALGWRALEIVLERAIANPQRGLFDDEGQGSPESLEARDDSPVRKAAELFLAKEYGLPYYYGPERVARLASLNIAQFLGMAGDCFEELISAELIGSDRQVLSAQRQHDLMKKSAQSFWDDIPHRVRYGRELRRLLESIGQFCTWYTYRPTAPNDPGVAGTAIRMDERRALMTPELVAKQPEWERFVDLLASALAHNYLIADLDYKCKGHHWMVLNLNRLLCVHFDLPLNYGQYKERSLKDLCNWMHEPFSVSRRQGSMV